MFSKYLTCFRYSLNGKPNNHIIPLKIGVQYTVEFAAAVEMMKSFEETKTCTRHLNEINSLPCECGNYCRRKFSQNLCHKKPESFESKQRLLFRDMLVWFI